MTSSFCKQFTYSSLKQLFRYGLVGVLNNLLGYLAYLLLTYRGMDHKIVMTFLYMLGATIGYFSNRQWTFKHKGKVLSSALRYFVAHFCGYLMNLLLLLVLVDKLGYQHQLVQAAAIIIVACFLYMMFKFFVFRDDMFRKSAA